MKWLVLGVGGVVLFAALSLGSTRQTAAAAEPAELFDQFVSAINSGDVASALGLFSSDAVMELTAASAGVDLELVRARDPEARLPILLALKACAWAQRRSALNSSSR